MIKTYNFEDTIKQLNSKNKQTRLNAIRTLQENLELDAIGELLKNLNDKDKEIQAASLAALIELADQNAPVALVDALIDALKNNPLTIYVDIIAALGRTKSLNALPSLIEALNEKDENLRYEAAWQLSNFPTLEATLTLPLVKALQNSNDYVRIFAAKALGKIEKGKGKATARSEEPILSTLISILIEALDDSEKIVRHQAAEELVSVAQSMKVLAPEVSKALIKIVEGDFYWYTQCLCLDQLKKVKDLEMIMNLVKTSQSKDSHVYSSAIDALKCFAQTNKKTTEKIMPVLENALEDKTLDVRRAVVSLLESIGNDKAISLLSKALEDPDINVHTEAAKALGNIGSKMGTPALIKALEKCSFSQFWTTDVIEALGKIGDKKAIPALEKVCYSNYWTPSNAAKEALRKITLKQEK